jgi:CheY-like chemotaxis protein
MLASNSPECNILIIDDEPAARYVVAGFFRAENCVTYEAQNGVEGLRMAHEIKPRLVLVDLHMPGMSGYDVLDSLKAHSELCSIPVAVVTSATLTDRQRRNLEYQTCAIIDKSTVSRERMHRLLDLVLRQAAAAAGEDPTLHHSTTPIQIKS